MKGGYYQFGCDPGKGGCGWSGIRYGNFRRCPKCLETNRMVRADSSIEKPRGRAEELEAEVTRLQGIIDRMAARIARQSELLSRAAERKEGEG